MDNIEKYLDPRSLSPSNLVTILRIIYPGILLTTFIYWRYREIVTDAPNTLLFFVILAFGAGFHTTYRYGFYEIIIWNIERAIGTKHQWTFHCYMLNKLKEKNKISNTKNLKKHGIAMSCVGEIMRNQPIEFKEHNNLRNSFVHVTFMNLLLCVLFGIHDSLKTDFNLLIWVSGAIIFLLLGLYSDNHADQSETVILNQQEDDYKQIIERLTSL